MSKLWSAFFVAALLYMPMIKAQDEKFVLGQHYQKVSERIKNKKEVRQMLMSEHDKVKVMMFFNYGCYWCSQLNEPFKQWKEANKDKVKSFLYPVSFNKVWALWAKAYYVTEILDSTEKLSDAVFKGIHQDDLPLWKEDSLEKFFVDKGIDEKKVKEVFASFAVEDKVKKANEASITYEISSTPNIIVAGPKGLYITNLVMTQEIDDLFLVLDYLLKEVI